LTAREPERRQCRRSFARLLASTRCKAVIDITTAINTSFHRLIIALLLSAIRPKVLMVG